MSKYLALCVLPVFLIAMASGCGEKKDGLTTDGKDSLSAAGLIKKDSVTGKDKVRLKYIVRKGDIFRYRMLARTSTTENSPATEGKDVKQDNEINYYYTKEVNDLEQYGIISYKVRFDSILINAQIKDQSIAYRSNVDDSVRKNPAFIQYNAVINEPFYMRVTSEGEISDIYGLEKIYENLFKALGDTLKEEDKMSIRESFGEESIKEILQQEYQMFPKQEIIVDSSWVKSYSTQVLFFDVVNSARYVLKSVEDKENNKIANIEASLSVDFLSKEVKEKGMKVTVEDAETSGTGKIAFNMSRGCISGKETTTTLKLNLKLSAQGQSAKSQQNVVTNLSVTLLN